MAFYLLENEGLFIGPSAALNVVGAVKAALALGPGHTVCTVICDGGERYLSRTYKVGREVGGWVGGWVGCMWWGRLKQRWLWAQGARSVPSYMTEANL